MDLNYFIFWGCFGMFAEITFTAFRSLVCKKECDNVLECVSFHLEFGKCKLVTKKIFVYGNGYPHTTCYIKDPYRKYLG